MAISNIQPLFVLIASLFFLPTLRAVDFEYCNKSGYDIGRVTHVDIFPRPEGGELSIVLFGFAKDLIRHGSFIEVYAKSEEITDLLKRFDICEIGPCPIIPGFPFEIRLNEIPMYQLEGDYKYEVALLDESSGEPTVTMCINFSLPTSLLKMVSA